MCQERLTRWVTTFPGEYGQRVREVWTAQQILDSHWDTWCAMMTEAGQPAAAITRTGCIESWVIENWAEEIMIGE